MSLATTMIAAAEGAVVLAPAERSLEPLMTVQQQLITLATIAPDNAHHEITADLPGA